MRVPISWLREYVDLPEAATPEDILASLVAVGFEEEDVHRFGVTGPVVVGQVLAFTPEPQSNGKTINWCQVDVGEPEPRGIVCGAHNFVVGDKVVVSLPGAVLPGPFPIAARTTYGHVSDGMIASARELGLGDEHDGILRLASLGLDPAVGTDALALLGLDDVAVEINVTPDRGYAFSLRGVAREYSHSTGAAFRDPALRVPPREGRGFAVSVDDAAPIRGRVGCSVFVTRVVRGIDPSLATPTWMISRLALAGIRSISLVVDITNYVMLELGQPTHGYDLDRLRGGITVRRARPGETLTTLDDQVRALHPEDLLITDDSGPIGLAGVMGGASTEIGSSTTNVLVEAANFDPVSIARSARRHKLPSEASKRFERGVDPLVATAAAARVVELLVDLGGGVADDLGSTLIEASAPVSVSLRDGFVAALIGVDYSAAEVEGTLAEIGATVERVPGGYTVTPPSWRPDLTDAATLAEEVARIVGYERIPSVLPVAPPGRGLSRAQRLRRSLSTALAAGGLTEVLSYPFLSRGTVDAFSPAADAPLPAVALANPLDAAAPLLRPTLLPGLVETARRNLSRGLTDLALFEVGTVVQPEPGARYGSAALPAGGAHPGDTALAALNASIPPQHWHVGALFLGDAITKQPGQPAVPSGIADALAAVSQIAAALGTRITVDRGEHSALHPGRTARLLVGEVEVGVAGELLPALAQELDLPRVVAVVELDLDALIATAPAEVTPHPIVAMPAATQDLSLIIPIETAAGQVLDTVIEGAGPLLEHASLVDDYRGAGVHPGHKSLTFALRFRAPDRTLTQAEATEAKNAAVALAQLRHGAVLRE
ncbi:phenylalanine--tRNA ligase subunit beta [Galbitalea soli]|uniref:Phenylalanine--tRNA ligase beta subunit n=1 Tax=Galbitalea soli TaxID=1268042 RepID=A0A7C9TP26_9MICO|nr:phenylalanine--tRNA ligase subunit beta [Galbitalea soli]NEM89900.1 phenylalanine--tRNA ligase subunit beta [Galbitalea soli]NYJ30604.1 phenylalanyl-tRNA synthetase beta chain [Galbitalea soli]